jgi:hypothetical protein
MAWHGIKTNGTEFLTKGNSVVFVSLASEFPEKPTPLLRRDQETTLFISLEKLPFSDRQRRHCTCASESYPLPLEPCVDGPLIV